MFRRYPYWGWLALCLVLWCINGYHFHLHRQELLPERMARAVHNDLQRREDAYNTFIGRHDLMRRLFADSLTENDAAYVNSLPFYLFAYSNDSLKYWNTNVIISGANDSAGSKKLLIRNDKGIFMEQSPDIYYVGNHKQLVVLFPVLITYPLENSYLKSHFAASDIVPVKTKIIAPGEPDQGEYPITINGINLFSLHFHAADIQRWTPDALFIVMLIAAILATISWIQLMIIHLTRNKSPLVGFIITVGIIALLRSLLYVFGLPFNLDMLTFFSPQLYASSKYLSSFGDLFINTLCFLWLVIFLMRHTPYKTYFSRLRNAPTKYITALVLITDLILYSFLFIIIIRSLVLDSRISFDVSHFYSINVYTILGLLEVGSIIGISCLVIYLFNVQLNVLINSKWVKYGLLAALAVLSIFISGTEQTLFPWALLAWFLLFIALIDIPKFTLVSDLFEPHMVFWAVFICLFGTGILQYFNQLKEKSNRIAYVKLELSPHRDDLAEAAFDKAANAMAQDKTIKSFFYKPTINGRKALNHTFDAQYLSSPALNKYEPTVYLFDADGKGLFNNDSTDFATLMAEKDESSSTLTPYLFYKESILDRHYYLSYIKVYSDTINNVIGYIIVDLDLKNTGNETVNSELLQPTPNRERSNEYAHAIYINDKLIAQTNDYPFKNTLTNDTLQEQHYAFYTNRNVSELYYKIGDKRTIVAVHYHSELIELVTLFSYLFVILVLIAVVILLYQLYLSYFTSVLDPGKFVRLTLRKRVHFSMLGVVLFSFIIIGGLTIWFLMSQYRSSNENKLQSVMQVTKQSVQDYLKAAHAFDADYIFDSVTRSTPFKHFITNLAGGQKIDINIYDDRGILFNTSEDDIFNKGLLSNRMRPDAYYLLNNEGLSIVIQDEKIAALSYLSAYEPLRDEHGITLGYINIPLFSSEKDLNLQISNIVITLINIYAFIFLISSLLTVPLTRGITRTFNVIIRQFEQLNLQRNERITWPYDDEIGTLVAEYNKMVNKVEENAARLAQSERESAWREMARQIAHEIKNPLTPMKLNIQYLQQALHNDSPNIKELTDKVSESIIQQIDNLSYIASEFSNFAKMPEARPELLELGSLLAKATELYLNDADILVTIDAPQEKVYVFSDRSQLLRVLNNLLENAKQAIPADKQGTIQVELKAENGEAEISISDNGEGIPEDIVKKIFQPYFTTKSSGTGLGLAMTRKIIEFWKGEIWFDTKEGEGTTFYIRLPATPNP